MIVRNQNGNSALTSAASSSRTPKLTGCQNWLQIKFFSIAKQIQKTFIGRKKKSKFNRIYVRSIKAKTRRHVHWEQQSFLNRLDIHLLANIYLVSILRARFICAVRIQTFWRCLPVTVCLVRILQCCLLWFLLFWICFQSFFLRISHWLHCNVCLV